MTPDLRQIVRSESVGGTHANRMIHRESRQLFIGPYVIDQAGRVRVIPRTSMPGRLTGTARHLTDPAGKVYFATMEEGLYEVDVHSLAVTGLIADGNGNVTNPDRPAALASTLPGLSRQGPLLGPGTPGLRQQRRTRRGCPSRSAHHVGCLAEWRGSGDWTLVRRNQFTEVTGPGGIEGATTDADPVWSIGWDHRSLILMLLDGGRWHAYRLPKASHAYDGAHGWNTEWPRIRDIGEDDLLMTMHGMFWRFPQTFARTRSAGMPPALHAT